MIYFKDFDALSEHMIGLSDEGEVPAVVMNREDTESLMVAFLSYDDIGGGAIDFVGSGLDYDACDYYTILYLDEKGDRYFDILPVKEDHDKNGNVEDVCISILLFKDQVDMEVLDANVDAQSYARVDCDEFVMGSDYLNSSCLFASDSGGYYMQTYSCVETDYDDEDMIGGVEIFGCTE